jgi:YesN/AraC family two-component response regulator
MSLINSINPYFKIVKINDAINKEELSRQNKPESNLYRVFFVEVGKITVSTSKQVLKAEPNTILFIPNNIDYKISINKKTIGRLINFNECFFNISDENYSLSDYLIFHQQDDLSIIRLGEIDFNGTTSIVNLMELEIENDSSSKDLNLHKLLIYFLNKSKEKFEAENERLALSNSKKPNPLFSKFKQLIESDYAINRNISKYANELNIHPYCLNEISKQSTGHTASEIIHGKIISETKKLISDNEKSFKEIAYELGFDDPAYFSRYFKKHTGSTLSFFKKSLT